MSRENIVWGKVVAVLLSEGWRPPDPSQTAVENILDDIGHMHYTQTLELTKRQYEIIRLMAIGYTIPQVAAALCIGQETVKTHLKSLQNKLGVCKTVHAVYLLTKQGLI
jgi:DNA-binding NarL/FixJ family response regulator